MRRDDDHAHDGGVGEHGAARPTPNFLIGLASSPSTKLAKTR